MFTVSLSADNRMHRNGEVRENTGETARGVVTNGLHVRSLRRKMGSL